MMIGRVTIYSSAVTYLPNCFLESLKEVAIFEIAGWKNGGINAKSAWFISAAINTAKCPRTIFLNILFCFIMDISINLMIDNDKVDLLKNFKSRIESLFKVLISLGKEGQGTRWINVSTPTGNANTVQAAKEYVCSLCIPESERHQQSTKYSGEIYQKLLQVRDQIERESGAIVCFEGDLTIVVSGRDANVSSACSLFEQTLRELDEQPFVKRGPLERTKKLAELKLESEDSSYDSEGCEEVETQHEEVHRTVSDTLQAEYADFVDSRQQKVECSPGFLAGCPQEDDDEDDPLDDPYFTSKVEFGLKLGYTEKQVLQALKKLGPSPDENELLGELIRVGANTKGVCLYSTLDFKDDSSNLRHIVIDGSNVAKSHGNKEVFSCRGIQLAVDWFRKRGHRDITVFVPQWRKEASRPDAPITDQDVLLQLEKEQILVFTPSRRIGGKRTICYDDRYIIKLAAEVDGIVVSNDNYRDLLESPEFKKIIEERVLMYSFVNDRFMPPDDPLGRHGPSLDNFLLKEPVQTDPLARPCPYSKKCTYGNKCKFYHPERGNQPQKSVTEALMENAKEKIKNLRRDSSPAGEILKTKLAPTQSADAITELLAVKKQPLNRTKSLVTGQLPSKPIKSLGKEDMPNQGSSTVSGVSAKMAGLNVGDRDFNRINTPSLNPAGASWPQSFRRSSIPGGDSALPGWNPLIVGAETLPSRNTVQSLGFTSDHGGHLALAKRLSDPDNHKPLEVTAPPEKAPPNTHQKLKRLLSLNPNDTRAQQPWRMAHSQPEHPPPEAMTQGQRRHLCRQSSYSDNHGYAMRANASDDIVHPSLTRISSAPDSQRNSHRRAQGHMRRQNSSSDPQLNIHQEFLPELLTPTGDVFSYGEIDQNPWGPPHLIRHGFQRNVHPVSQPTTWLSSAGSGRQNQPMDAFYLPQPMHPPPPGVVVPSGNNNAVEDPRFKLYYHLSSVFPEEQVRVVMNRHPEETNPQKICSVILEMYSRSYMH